VIKILLADDHNVVREGIRFLLGKHTEIEIIGEGSNGMEILEILRKVENKDQIDLVLADLNMPEMDGINLTLKIKEEFKHIKVVILSMLDHEKYIYQAYQAGANGYLLKSISEEELVFSLSFVIAGNFYLSAEISQNFIDKMSKSPIIHENQTHANFELSSRELEILELIADGYTNIEIADKLFTSKRTVEGHRLQMISKIGVRNTAALMKFAFSRGLIKPD
jgi:DNA-binding NarL/FixJ family response regulator